MKIEVLTGPPGCGKSTAMREAAIRLPALYLFASPTIKLIREQAEAFRVACPSLDVTEADSKARGQGSGSVQKRLDETVARIERDGVSHAIVLVTHESLMGSDLSGLTGWHARIDEAPNAVQSGTVKAPASVQMLETAFALDPLKSKEWSVVRPLNTKSSWRDLANDDLLKHLGEFIKQANRAHGVFVNAREWTKSFGWCSVWLPTALSHFASCQIAGASYPTSLGAVIAQRWLGNEVTLIPTMLTMNRTRQPNIRVHYFTQSHEGTSTLWEGHAGRGLIVKVCDFLAATEPALGFWSGNKEVQILMDHRVNGGPIEPKVAGLNEYRDRTSCAFIYSSKPTPDDKPVQTLFGITDDEISRAREDEDIVQFAMRGAIRQPDFGGDYDIYLYSKRQAETLVAQLAASGIGQAVTLVPEDGAGIMNVDPDPAKSLKAAVSASKGVARKEKDKLRKRKEREDKALAAGRPPGGKGGRPKLGV